MDISSLPSWIIATAFIIIAIVVIILIAYSIKLYINNGTIKIGSFTISKYALKADNNTSPEENFKEDKSDSNIYSWNELEVGIKNLRHKLIQSRYNPSLIVGIGRGGAIVSALLSASLNHIHFIALEREYDWSQKKRNCKIFDDVKFSRNLDRVLLVAGDLVTGGTAEVFTEYLNKLGAKEIKFLTFIKVKSSTKIPDYFFIETDSCDFKLPWMLTDDYLKDSRDDFKC